MDTSVLADALLEKGDRSQRAQAALRHFTSTLLPVYAIKEFKAGALKNYAWLHNKLAAAGSLKAVLGLLAKMLKFKPNIASSALEAISQYDWSFIANGQLAGQYGQAGDPDRAACDALRLQLKVVIHSAWRRRRQVTTDVVCPLGCYTERPLVEENGQLLVDPCRCEVKGECSMAADLKKAGAHKALETLRAAVPNDGRRESTKRRQVLEQLVKRPGSPLTEERCRDLGDAVFAFYAPSDAAILTTNIRDHAPLAAALGKVAISPDDIDTK